MFLILSLESNVFKNMNSVSINQKIITGLDAMRNRDQVLGQIIQDTKKLNSLTALVSIISIILLQNSQSCHICEEAKAAITRFNVTENRS